MEYIQKHWRGEHSLVRSFWVNVVLIKICITVIQTLAIASATDPISVLKVTIPIALAIYLWQIVGLWRSANRYTVEAGGTFWPIVVKVLVVIGVLATFGEVTRLLTLLQQG